jgi:outer membrane immunogenic protein
MNCTCLKLVKLPLTAAFVIAAFSAQAADIYTPAAPAYAAVALPPNWGGFYAGINGGYGGNSGLPFREDVFFPGTPPVVVPPAVDFAVNPYSVIRGTDTIAGGFGGGQIGYNFQFGSFVIGAEGDIQGSGIRGNGSRTIFTNLDGTTANGINSVCQASVLNPTGFPGGVCEGRNSVDVDWFGTVRGRLGWSIGNVLLYGTGGFAAGGVKATSLYTDNNIFNLGGPIGLVGAANNPPQFGRTSHSATNTGWTAGGGIEVKITPNWSLKGEYQFINLGTIDTGPGEFILPTALGATATPCATPGNPACLHLTSSKDVDFHTVRVGLNYYFNAPSAPLPLK